MKSNSERRRVKLSTLGAGLVGMVAGTLMMGLMPNLSGAQSAPLNSPAKDGITVTLHFKKSTGSAKTLELQGCAASENSGVSRQCIAEQKMITRNWSGQAAIEWNGNDGGSGCATVGGERFCW